MSWLNSFFLVLVLIALFCIVGTMERLPPDAEAKLEAWRQVEQGVLVAEGRNGILY